MPQRDFLLDRDFIQFTGGKSGVTSLDVGIARRLTMEYALLCPERRYEIEYFFMERMGRAERFWCPLWLNLFVMQTDIAAWTDKVRIDPCGFSGAFVAGVNRLYIELNDGSRISRLIVSVTDEGTYEELTIATVFDQDIDIDDVAYCSLILLCRFDHDDLELDFVSADTCKTTLSLIELTHEYATDEEL